jgi:hypothetical protein
MAMPSRALAWLLKTYAVVISSADRLSPRQVAFVLATGQRQADGVLFELPHLGEQGGSLGDCTWILGLADYRVVGMARQDDGRLVMEVERRGIRRYVCAGCGRATGRVRDAKVRTARGRGRVARRGHDVRVFFAGPSLGR